MATAAPQTAVITGASRGIGFETARQLGDKGYRLLLAATRQPGLDKAISDLRNNGYAASGHVLDQGDAGSVEAYAAWVRQQVENIDVLVNCAGIYPEKANNSLLSADTAAVLDTFNVNTLGPWRLIRAFANMINENGRIVNVSSEMASLTGMQAGSFGYRASKTALNALTRVAALELAGRRILVNSADPGWVRTDMGGASAPRNVQQGAAGIVWAATLPAGGPTGGYFCDGQPLDW